MGTGFIAGNGISLSLNNATKQLTISEDATDPTPTFQAYMSADRSNVTGAGTEYTMAFDVEDFDVGSNFNTGTYTFTADRDGSYCITSFLRVFGLSAAMTYVILKIVTSNQTYQSQKSRAGTGTDEGMVFSVIANMEANDTAYVTATIQNGAGDTADITGNNNPTSTNFSGAYLI